MASARDEALARLTGPGGPFEISEHDVLGVQVRAYQVGPRTLAEILEASRARGSLDYLVYDDERYSYAHHYDLVAGLAHHLADRYGIGWGDRIVIAMRNYPEFPFFFWAAQALGAVAVLLNAWWTESELQFGLDDSEADFLVVDHERLERMKRIIPAARRLRGVVSVRTELALDGVMPFAELRERLQAGLTLPSVEIGTDDLATILYTSGTTGRARGAMHSHRNHCTNLLNAQVNAAIAAEMAGIEPDPGPGPQRGGLAHMPLFHISQLSSLYIGMAAGSKSVLMYRWDAERALELIERERLTSFGGVPLQVQGLFDSPSLHTRDLSSLESFGFAATAIAPEKVLRVHKLFGGRVAAGTGYGMTEATSAVTLIGGQEYWEHPDSVGRPTPVNDIKIVDEQGNEVPTGEVGELWVKGPNIVRGYWRSPEATALAFSDGWHHSGDVARVDGEGRVYLVDRIKDVVIRAGENVYCGEVEAVLYDHPAVHTAAVFGLPHERLGEEVAAVVRLADGCGSTTAEELQRHTAERLARFKVPSRIEFITEDVPRTATGKIMKRALRDGLAGSSGTGQATGR